MMKTSSEYSATHNLAHPLNALAELQQAEEPRKWRVLNANRWSDACEALADIAGVTIPRAAEMLERVISKK